MARILALDDVTLEFRNVLLRTLRPQDECILLPQSNKSAESSAFKNVVFTLAGALGDVPASIFSCDWSCGISAVRLDDRDVEPLLRDPHRRKELLQKLADAIPSDLSSSDTSVGPELDCDEDDCDKDWGWVAGFDGPSCLVGLYCSEHSRPPETTLKGQNRVHRESYLVCRAGAGLAAATFHTRLMSSLRKGKTLDDALLGGFEPGPQALRRIMTAGSRNRASILLKASEILGFVHVCSLGDQASKGRRRGAVLDIDVNVNTIKQVDERWMYSTGVDCASSQGLIVSSNVSDGFVVFCAPNEGRLVIRNEANSCVPFGSVRLHSARDMADIVLKKHVTHADQNTDETHVDHVFIRDRFAWVSRDFGPGSAEVMPFCLHGSHSEETFVNVFSRELGLVKTSVVRLRPELVALAGVEPRMLRPLIKSVNGYKSTNA